MNDIKYRLSFYFGVYAFVLLVISGCASTAPTNNETAGTSNDSIEVASAPNTSPVPVPTTIPRRETRRSLQAVLDTVRAGRFDSGKMWTFDDPPTEYLNETYNFSPDEEWFERARLGALRFATYCSASFVSPHGLVMTNHHCARQSVTEVSQPGENLPENGFYAPDLESERRVPGLFVDQLIDITDVTEEVFNAIQAAQTDAERAQAREDVIEQIRERITSEAGGEEAGIVVQVISLYHGGRYSAYTFRRYSDVRLVIAPEHQIGFFGGDSDNFTYPRYALDMSFFRVYGENGQPLQTEHYFTFSDAGASDGDLVFVIGNPGSTNRLETVAQLEFRRDIQEKYLLDFIDSRVAALEALYEDNPSEQLRNQLLSLKNSQKVYTGRVKGLNDPVLMARRRDTERQFAAAIEENAELSSQYGGLIDEMAEIQVQKRELSAEYISFMSLFPNSSLSATVLRRAMAAYNYLVQQQSGVSSERTEAIRNQILGINDQPAPLQQMYLEARLERFVEQFGAESEIVREILDGRTVQAAAQQVVNGSVLVDSARTARALESGSLNLDDPAIQIAAAIMPRYSEYQSAFAGLTEQEREIASQLGRARFEIYGTDIPPDATFSLRIADGIVAGYPYNGTIAPPYTTFYGLYDHYYSYGPGTEWDIPERWLNPPETFELKTPVNIVSTNDIIGGNSGSPLLNRDLEVVGLVFDGNIESLPSSFIYTDEVARAVSVDSRGMLEALDEIYDADRLVLELTEQELVDSEAQADARQ